MKHGKYAIILSSDWEGLYIDGKLVAQGHRLPIEQVLQKLGFEPDAEFDGESADEEWLEMRCELPENLADVVIEDRPNEFDPG